MSALEALVHEWATARRELVATDWDKTKVYDPEMMNRLANAEAALAAWARQHHAA